MTTLPEKIYIDATDLADGMLTTQTADDAEYVRGDLFEAAIQALIEIKEYGAVHTGMGFTCAVMAQQALSEFASKGIK